MGCCISETAVEVGFCGVEETLRAQGTSLREEPLCDVLLSDVALSLRTAPSLIAASTFGCVLSPTWF